MKNKLGDIEQALGLVADSSHLAFGGQPLAAKPMAFINALAGAGRRQLEVTALFGSFDFEILARAGALSATRSSYVGLDHFGPAAGHADAVAAGTLKHYELTEYMIMRGFDAAGHGLPFLPTHAAVGSDIAADLDIATVTCPYSGEELLAVPAIKPDLAVIHAEAADGEGNVLGPAMPGFLWDHDRTVARAARQVIVTVERICDRSEIVANADRTLLTGFEVDLVVEAPHGAAPLAFLDHYGADRAALSHLL